MSNFDDIEVKIDHNGNSKSIIGRKLLSVAFFEDLE